MSSYCLDTSAYSHFQRGDEKVVALIDAAEWIGMPAVTLGELRAGFMIGGQRERNEKQLAGFLDHPAVEIVPVDSGVSRQYAEIVNELRTAGTPLPTNDIWIAASAAESAAAVITYDEHFRAITRIGSLVLSR